MNETPLADFLSVLEDQRELVRVSVEVDPQLELPAITQQVCKSPGGGPAVLFEQVTGSRFPVVVNLLGSSRRLCRALRIEQFEELTERIAALLHPAQEGGLLKQLSQWTQGLSPAKLVPHRVKTGMCQQVVKPGDEARLEELPQLVCDSTDSRPVFPSALLVLPGNSEREPRVSLHRFQLRPHRKLAVYLSPHSPEYQQVLEGRSTEQEIPVAVVCGGDPLLTALGAVPLPTSFSLLHCVGLLRKQAVSLVPGRTREIQVPAEAELIIEGIIEPQASPGAVNQQLNHSEDAASSVDKFVPETIIQVTGITHRANAVLPLMIPGGFPAEENIFTELRAAVLLPVLRELHPQLSDLHFPRWGSVGNALFVGVRKQYPAQVSRLVHLLSGLPALHGLKLLVVVDSTIDVHNEAEVWRTVLENHQPAADVTTLETPAAISDYSTLAAGVGSLLAIDGTRKKTQDGFPHIIPQPSTMPEDIRELLHRRWAEYGFTSNQQSTDHTHKSQNNMEQ